MARKMKKPAEGLGVSEREKAPWGHGEYANMPKDVVEEIYPRNRAYRGNDLDDTITGIDHTITRSESTTRKHISNQH